MSDDLVKRLRNEKMGCNLWCEYYDGITTIPLCIEAADHIEKLEAALARIAKYDTQAIAMDALRPGERIRDGKNE